MVCARAQAVHSRHVLQLELNRWIALWKMHTFLKVADGRLKWLLNQYSVSGDRFGVHLTNLWMGIIPKETVIFDLSSNFMHGKLIIFALRRIAWSHKGAWWLSHGCCRWPIFTTALLLKWHPLKKHSNCTWIECAFSFSADYSAAAANIRKCNACTDIERIIAGCSSSTIQWPSKAERQLFAGCDASLGILCGIDPVRTAVHNDHWTAVHASGGWQFCAIHGFPSGSNDDHSTFLDADNDDVDDPVAVNNTTTGHHIVMVGECADDAVSQARILFTGASTAWRTCRARSTQTGGRLSIITSPTDSTSTYWQFTVAEHFKGSILRLLPARSENVDEENR